MGPELWKLVRDGEGRLVATHAVFAAAVKHSPLLGDFLRSGRRLSSTADVRQGHLRTKCSPITCKACHRSATPLTCRNWWTTNRPGSRLRSSVFQMLAQAGYIESTRSLKLQSVHIADQVIHCLKANREDYVLPLPRRWLA